MAIKLLKKKNYLTMIENSAKGENWMFRNLYAEISGEEKDILKNGGLSCAVLVSSILFMNKLIKDLHANVSATEKDMVGSGWREVKDLKPGAILIWETKDDHSHIGFYMGKDMAISNDSRGAGFPHKHHYTYNNTRKIERIYWHPNLDE